MPRRSTPPEDLDDRIQCLICNRYFKALAWHLVARHDVTSDEYKERFGVAKVTSERTRYKMSIRTVERGWGKKPWTDRMILDEIRERHAGGLSLAYARMEDDAMDLLQAGEQHFTSWRRAVEEAGFKYERETIVTPPGIWNRRLVVERILERHRDGKEMSARVVYSECASLQAAAIKRFGSWKAAIEAAGLDYDRIRRCPPARRWDRRKILAEISRLHSDGRLGTPTEAQCMDRGLMRAAAKRFGSWEEALETAGISYEDHLAYQKWSRERVVEALRKRHEEGRPMAPIDLRRDDQVLQAAAKRHFEGGLRDALREAGVDPDEVYHRIQWSPARIIRRIREDHENGLDLGASRVQRRQNGLYKAGHRCFGTWRAAVEAAGIDYDPYVRRPHRWGREKVLDTLREEAAAGRSLAPVHVRRRFRSLHDAVTRYIGGFEKALTEAGIDPDPHLMVRRLPPEKVLRRIEELHDRGEDLRTSVVSRSHPRLYDSARRLFGKWGTALRAAEVDLD